MPSKLTMNDPPTNICVLTVAYDSGHYRVRMGHGPDRLFESGLKPLLTRLGHNFRHEEITVSDSHPAEIKTAFALSHAVADRVRINQNEGYLPILLSGNCNTAVGAISGCGSQNTGVVWFDAHGESTTPETTSSGFLDGMGISILTGQCWRKLASTIPGFAPVPGKHILLVGARDLETEEIALLNRVGITRIAGDGDHESQVASLASLVDGVYLHLDLDVLDPREATANQWTPMGGLTIGAVQQTVKSIQKTTKIKGFGIASYDPELDGDGRALGAAMSIVELLLSTT
jgi:arginase